MSVFERYASYYDRLYNDKDYAAETRYIGGLLAKWASGARTVLDIGCGTGQHAALLAQSGMSVHGIDRSEEMIKIARDREAKTHDRDGGHLEFTCTDVRSLRLDTRFDVVTSLFHVMNYQTSVDAFMIALERIKDHLEPGGTFIFDTWYGPAVENLGPALRIKRFEDEREKIIRIAEPDYFKETQRVDVNYQMLVLNKSTGRYLEFFERHQIRYLFMAEIEKMLSDAGFSVKFTEEWLSGRLPSRDTWSVTVVARLNALAE